MLYYKVLLLLFCLSVKVNGKLIPGIKLHLNKRGIDSCLADLEKNIGDKLRRGMKLPDHHDHRFAYKFEISDAIAQNITFGGIAIDQASLPEQTVLNFRHVELVARSKWSYEVNAIVKIRDSGHVETSIQDSTVTVTVPRAMIIDKRLSIPVREIQCKCNLHKVNVQFSGSRSGVYNLLKPLFLPQVKKAVADMLCPESVLMLHAYFEEKTNNFLTDYSMTWPGSKQPLNIDLSFLHGPLASSETVTAEMAGVAYWKNSEDTGKSLSSRSSDPTLLHDWRSHSGMGSDAHLQYLVHEDFINSIFQSIYKENLFTKFKLGSEAANLVFALCVKEACGGMLRKMSETFHNTHMLVTVELNQAPSFVITKVGTPAFIVDTYVGFHIVYPNNTIIDATMCQFMFEYNLELNYNPDGLLYSSFLLSKKAFLTKIISSKVDLNPSDVARFGKILNDNILATYIKELFAIGVFMPKFNNQKMSAVAIENFNGYVVISANLM